MENLFDDVLEEDEKIIKIIKPDKGRYMKSNFFLFILPLFWVLLIITFFVPVIMICKNYNNTYYAYTNKRLIVRNGAFGICYKSLGYKDITSTAINVGLFDKRSKTGTLVFVSPSSHHENPISFEYIKNPYQEMNEIKKYIDMKNK